jgi:hypothetical protein
MTRLILFLLGSLSSGGSAFSGARHLRPGGVGLAPAPPGVPGSADSDRDRDRFSPVPPKRRLRFRWKWVISTALVALIFRRALAYLALTGLSAAVHLVGVNVHLPHLSFAWPWQSVTAGSASDVNLGPWVLQNIEGITKPALGTENFQFMFTHKVSKNIGIWPCWYAATFYVVGRASATVNLNPGSTWWAPSTGHYRLQVLTRPTAGKPGSVAVTITLPLPQLPQSVHDVSVDNSVSRPVSTQHSWTYPGFGCGVLLRPQFSESVLYAQAQTIAYERVISDPQISRPLIAAAESAATRIIRNNFIQPTVNRFGYTLDQFAIEWSSGAS